MATYYVYVLAVWLRLDTDPAEPNWLAELREYLEEEFCVIKLEVVEDSDSDRAGERTLSLQLQFSFEPSEMHDGEPTEAAITEVDRDLRAHLESKYRLSYLEVLDDALTSYLLAEEEEPAERRYPEPKLRELSTEEKSRLRKRIAKGETDIYALAAEFGCSSSQVAGIKAAMHR